MSMEECTTSRTSHASHMTMPSAVGQDDCPMAKQHQKDHLQMMHSNMDRFGYACACSVDLTFDNREAVVLQKVHLQLQAVVKMAAEDHQPPLRTELTSILRSDSYSPPPIYLSNESFLI